ncbi:formate dehydrogenase subunit gamma [Maritimibacter fusiformis]|uniref:Formate dehydrogenase subunit gamma n=1 Tax=Maritimibacter fusiformis TaxID=2603819 RepID=A0A5D0RED7_9RHOB|nr:formate dehydrogenase subunit gamma [Maritimibacter fusiformis]TYB79967.1 formate dehydrogenase subunit gamma [Maritimibacter fusiformis]
MADTAPEPNAETLADLIEAQRHLEGPLLPILHTIHEAYGHIPDTAPALIADRLNIGRAEVHGVISFYHDFRRLPAGRHVVKICRSEACQSVGGAALSEAVLAKLGIGWGETTANGAVTVEPVYCLGLCASGPAAMVDGKVIGMLDTDRFDRVLAELGA